MQRGYDAITITHGIVNRMDVVTLLNIVHSPRYSVLDVTARVSRRITVGRILWVLREFTRCFQVSVLCLQHVSLDPRRCYFFT